MKKLFAILMSIMMIACFMPTMAFAETAASVSGNEITAAVGNTISGTATITVTEGTFKGSLTADQSNAWVTNLPDGVTYTVAKDASNANKATITFNGSSNTPATTQLTFKIPAGQLTGDSTPEQEVTGNITLKITGHTVTVTAGTGMSAASGSEGKLTQQNLGGTAAMETLSFTASEGYYFPSTYAYSGDTKGLEVKRKDARTITVSGTPNGTVTINLADATEKQEAVLTSVKFTATGSDTGELTGVSVADGYSYKINDGKVVTIDSKNCTEGKVALTKLKKDDKITVMKAGNDTTKPGSTQFTVAQKDPPAEGTITATDCTAAGKDGKLTGVTTEMEYQEKGKEWKKGTGAEITGLTAGTYYVRTKASENALASTNLTFEIKGFPTATATGPDVIKGITTVELKAQDIIITLASATLKEEVKKGNDVSAWFDTLPAGLKATVKGVTGNTVTITISGTPTKEGNTTAKITIPQDKLVDGKEGGLPVAKDVTFSIAKYYHVVTGGGGGGAAAKPTQPTTPEQKPATAAGKTAANAAITTAAAANKYDKAEQAEVDQIVKEAEAKIKEAKTEDEVKAIQKDAETKLDKILTTEEKATIASLEEVSKRDFGTKSKKITKKNGKKAVKLSWAAPEGVDVDGYEIFRSTKKNSGYGTEPYFETPKTSYTNSKGLKSGKTYYYKVRAYVEINGERHYTDYSIKASRKI